MSRGISVTALIDWKSQMHNCGADKLSDRIEQASRTLQRTVSAIGKALNKLDKTSRYKVTLRLYHGWSKGYEWTPNRSAVVSAIAQTDFSVISRFPNIVINPEISYGDLLLSGLSHRVSKSKNIHLPGTLRDRGGDSVGEKMVDTALASDLLSLAFSDPKDWSIVLAEDDDLVPPIFTAEAWKDRHGGKVYLLRKRSVAKSKVLLGGLILEGGWND
jgi:hypothetical protein